MNVVDHQLQIVSMDVGIEASQDRIEPVVYQQVARLRDIHPLFITAVEHVTAQLKKGLLTSDFTFKRLQLQTTHKHKVVVVVDGDVATVAVENARVVGQQVLLLRPNAGE